MEFDIRSITGRTPMMNLFSHYNQISKDAWIKSLKAHSPNLSLVDDRRNTALHYAIQHRANVSLIDELLTYAQVPSRFADISD